jgi:hypothetical protein
MSFTIFDLRTLISILILKSCHEPAALLAGYSAMHAELRGHEVLVVPSYVRSYPQN